MTNVHDVPTPALLLDLEVLERNLDRMAARADRLGVTLRPHVKTHKCIRIGKMQRERGSGGITVSTLHEARVFAEAGFEDMTWAFPVIPGRVEEAVSLRRDGVDLRLVVDAEEAVEVVARAAEGGPPVRVWMKVDCGQERAGVDPESDRALRIADRISEAPPLRFDGVLTHSGQAYHAGSPEELAAAAEEERSVMSGCAERLRGAGISCPGVSVGSTPAMTHARDLAGVTEARPGNYAFFDYTQAVLGSCDVDDCAVTVLATVVSSPPGTDRCVTDAGALALSMDPGPERAPRPTMGEIVAEDGKGRLRDDVRVRSLSQEHGILSARLPWGEKVRILPNHSCLTVANFDEYQVVRGEEVVDRWPIRRGRG